MKTSSLLRILAVALVATSCGPPAAPSAPPARAAVEAPASSDPAAVQQAAAERARQQVAELLLADVRRMCRDKGLLAALADKSIDRLQAIMASQRRAELSAEREGALYAAVALAAFGRDDGIDLLVDHERYYQTSSEIEALHVRAALVLLGLGDSLPTSINAAQMSPELTKALQRLESR